jgi:hypothetical protein
MSNAEPQAHHLSFGAKYVRNASIRNHPKRQHLPPGVRHFCSAIDTVPPVIGFHFQALTNGLQLALR